MFLWTRTLPQFLPCSHGLEPCPSSFAWEPEHPASSFSQGLASHQLKGLPGVSYIGPLLLKKAAYHHSFDSTAKTIAWPEPYTDEQGGHPVAMSAGTVQSSSPWKAAQSPDGH